MKLKNKILGFGVSMALSIGLLLPPKAEAICNVNPAQIAETMFSMCWECIFPISMVKTQKEKIENLLWTLYLSAFSRHPELVTSNY